MLAPSEEMSSMTRTMMSSSRPNFPRRWWNNASSDWMLLWNTGTFSSGGDGLGSFFGSGSDSGSKNGSGL